MQVRITGAPRAELGESPFWHPQQQCLYYCDIAGRRLLRHDPRSGASAQWQFDSEPASCAPLPDGRLLLAMRDGLWCFDPAGGARRRLVAAPYDTATERFNDGKCDPQGRFWVGTVYEPREPALAGLYCWSQGQLRLHGSAVATSNGLAWSPDGRTLYWSDTRAHLIRAFDFDPVPGAISRPRVFASFEPRRPGQPLSRYGGRPDGAAVDAEGAYWVAMYEGQRLLRLSPGGQVLQEVELPVRCPTMPCFGGADLRTLYVTTARHGRPAEELLGQPAAGLVLALETAVPGLPVSFAGVA
ncbi:SMP-30/gluconolactonase/LRE family protein [Azohydromonas aeria]|uniref:SMP-30/gluconolactonase/LRE family protein n=1 Tax=Azohydromonas aeria TaxID=2590212 RepID=UPI0012FC9132|nr:SMP-30/gluconolactonase/LRE family protein [Azohydromonas aeria]